MRECRCAEGFLLQFSHDAGGKEITQPYRPESWVNDPHDCLYIVQRNALIPQAERWANAAMGRNPKTPEDTASWVQEFMAEMDRLAREAGIHARHSS